MGDGKTRNNFPLPIAHCPLSASYKRASMCTNFTPTQRTEWVKAVVGVDLPSDYPAESYPSFPAPWWSRAIDQAAWPVGWRALD